MDKDVEEDSEELEDAEGTEGVIQEGTGTLFDNLEDDNAALRVRKLRTLILKNKCTINIK